MLETVIVALIVAAAAGYAARRVWRTLRPAKAAGCTSDCGCGDAAPRDADWARTR